MSTEIEQLLKKRFKVIADWPGMNPDLSVGSILMVGNINGKMCWRHVDRGDLGGKSTVATIHGPEFYPHLFKELDFWEDLPIDQMPEYLQLGETGTIYKVSYYEQYGCVWMQAESKGVLSSWAVNEKVMCFFEPATEQEYLTSKPK